MFHAYRFKLHALFAAIVAMLVLVSARPARATEGDWFSIPSGQTSQAYIGLGGPDSNDSNTFCFAGAVSGYLENDSVGWSISVDRDNTWDLDLFEDVPGRNVMVNVVCIPMPAGATLEGEYGTGTDYGVSPGTSWDMFNANSMGFLMGESGPMSGSRFSSGVAMTYPNPAEWPDLWVATNAAGNGWMSVQYLTFATAPLIEEIVGSNATSGCPSTLGMPVGDPAWCAEAVNADNTWYCGIGSLYGGWSNSVEVGGQINAWQSNYHTSDKQWFVSLQNSGSNRPEGDVVCFKPQ